MANSPRPNAATRIREVRIAEWDAFGRYIDGRDGWAFRGQRDASWPILSSLSRRLRASGADTDSWSEREERAIRIFRRKAHIYLPDRSALNDTLRCLAMMQHHGAPTRLLDFTWSPYVAAFFALESSVTDAAVWAINSTALGSFAYGPDFPPAQRPPSPVQVLREVGVRRRDAVAMGEPYWKNRRLIAQSGTFAFPLDITRPVDEILSGRKGVVAKLVLRGRDLRRRAMRELYMMNITHATLFPDLDGLARSLAFELEHHFAFDPTQDE